MDTIPNTHLNVFHSYERDHHENQLTRGLMILLKLSPTVFYSFYEYLRETCNAIPENVKDYSLPSLYNKDVSDRAIDTQTSYMDLIADKLISVLITNERPESHDHKVKDSDRGRIYDGVISIGDEFIAILENKLDSKNIDREQFNPNIKSKISKAGVMDITYLEKPVILTWSEVIKILTTHLINKDLTRIEAQLIRDFLSLVNTHFSYLNPFDKFSVCADNPELIGQRLTKVLKDVVILTQKKEYNVAYHRGWAYKIEIDRKDKGINQIDFPIKDAGSSSWSLSISMQFGVTLEQIRAFYKLSVSYDTLSQFCESYGWTFDPIIHIGHMYESRVHIDTDITDGKLFYEYWEKNIQALRQFNPAISILDEIRKLKAVGILNDIQSIEEDLHQKYLNNPNITKLNLRPTIGLGKIYTREQLLSMDDGKGVIARQFFNDIHIALKTIIKVTL